MKAQRHTIAVLTALLIASVPAFADTPLFTDVSAEVGLTGQPAFRLSITDINGDGYPDIFAHRASNDGTGDVLDKQYIYLNVPGSVPTDPFSRAFVDFTAESNIRANRAGTPAGRHSDSAIFADVDNDGDLDAFTLVYVHREYTMVTDTNDLLLNDGDGHFTLCPNSPFHNDPIYNTAAAVFVDYDNDSAVDLFLGNWYFNDVLSRDQLYQGHGDGSFTNTTLDSGISAGSTAIYGVGAWDWNGDGWQDLFAPSYSHTATGATYRQWMNNRDGTFRQVQDTTGYGQYGGFQSGRASFGSMPYDFDNDGDIDHMEIWTHGTGDGLSGIHTNPVINDGIYRWDFSLVSGRASEDPDTTHHGDHYASWADWDNDGLVDFTLTESGYDNNRFYVFQQAPDHTFSPVTVASGVNSINTNNMPSHNSLALDYDLDGDQDMLVGFSTSDNMQLWRNENGTNNNWIVFTLEGGGSSGYANRSAIGARLSVTADTVTQTREVWAGPGHHGPQMPLSMHYGLGQATVVDSATIRWPNTALSRTELSNLCINKFLRVREICTDAEDPVLMAIKQADDVAFSWQEPGDDPWWWNVYREEIADTSAWTTPYAGCVADQDTGTAGIQFTDAGAVPGPPTLYFYQATAMNDCGETGP